MSGIPSSNPRLRLKTYSHLNGAQKIPSDYEISTSQLLYYPQKGFEVKTPIVEWYQQYQANSPLTAKNWDKFKDFRETTYTRYVDAQKKKEIFVEGIFESIEQNQTDLNPAWKAKLVDTLSVLRFIFHGLQMSASYIGSMAPAGRLSILWLFQSADEIRKIQTFSYRLCQLSPDVQVSDQTGRNLWQAHPQWQPLRKLIENLLITYDWGEAFVALNTCIKPEVDKLFLVEFAKLAEQESDYHFQDICRSLYEDSLWHTQWSQELAQFAAEQQPDNQTIINNWTAKWMPPTRSALNPIRESMRLGARHKPSQPKHDGVEHV